MPTLTPKQARFVDEYLIDLNGTKAAIRAGYSKRIANQYGPLLLTNPKVKAAVDAAKAERSEATRIDAEWVLRRLVEEVEADMADLFDGKGDIKPIDQWPEIWRRGLVNGLDVDALFEGVGDNRKQIGYTKKIRFSDRLRRLELIGKHINVNAFADQVNVSGLDTLVERMRRVEERDAAHGRTLIGGAG